MAGPPSPEYPALPFPAKVLIVPGAGDVWPFPTRLANKKHHNRDVTWRIEAMLYHQEHVTPFGSWLHFCQFATSEGR